LSLQGRSVHRRRRHRSHFRRISLTVLALVLAGFMAWRIVPASQQSSSSMDALLNSDSRLAGSNADLASLARNSFSFATSSQRGRVYPYSVVPGGVRSPEDLHQASLRDRVVGKHFSGFDFRRAKVVELGEPRLAYLSYRIGNKVFWTKKRVHLRKGEKLVTDGVISARTRCANQVSATPQNAVSAEEPPAETFEDPFEASGAAKRFSFPGNFESALFNRELVPFDPQGPPGSPLFGPGGGGGFPAIFPPPIPSGRPPIPSGPPPITSGGCDPTKEICSPGEQPPPPSLPPPTPVPEPGTIVLISTGLAGIYMRYRKVI
jgi:PEP-CTERM motif